MSLMNAKGLANSPEIFQHLLGEEITGVFMDGGALHIAVKSGYALGLTGTGSASTGTGPSYWVISPDEVQKLVKARADKIIHSVHELANMPGIDLKTLVLPALEQRTMPMSDGGHRHSGLGQP